MRKFENAMHSASNLLRIESEAIGRLQEVVLSSSFENSVKMILETSGRVVVSGIGKSGIIGQKIAATLASTGTPSFFMHPGEALHGDLGMTREEDVFILLSNSGETEVIQLLPSLKLFGNKIIAITGKGESTLARESDAVILYTVDEEGCPIGLAPMASTTATLAIGDALAAALMSMRDFERKDFAKFHPAGSLGRKLLTRVKDLMVTDFPCVDPEATMSDALQVMIETNLGALLVLSKNGELLGILSDGDVKRVIRKGEGFLEFKVSQVMTAGPKTIQDEVMAEVALREMEGEKRSISVLPVLHGKTVVGLLRMHDILRAKIR